MPHGEHDLEEAIADAIGDDLPEHFRSALARGLVKAVEVSTNRVAEMLSTTERRKLVTLTAIITAIIVAGFSIPVTYLLTNESSETARRDAAAASHREALTACRAQAGARPQGNARAFDQIVFFDILQDAVKATPQTAQTRAFQRKELETITKHAAYWRNFTVVHDKNGQVVRDQKGRSVNELPERSRPSASLPTRSARSR